MLRQVAGADMGGRVGALLFSCDQRENMAPATWSKGICGWAVITGTWRPLARRRRIWRTVSPLRNTIRCSARSTVVALVAAGAWISTSSVRKSSCGQSSPLKFLCLKVGHVDHFLETLRHFTRLAPEYREWRVYGAVRI